MFAFINFLLLFAAETGGHAAGGNPVLEFYNTYLNYPGFEAWKFINLFVFVAVLVYLLKKPLSTAFKTRREAIRQDLIKAQQERDAAMAKLSEVEARLGNLNAEAAAIREQSKREAEAEAARIAAQTTADIEKMRENARREIASAVATARRDLKQFSAEESIRLAEDMVRANLRGEDAARLVNASINGLGTNGGVKQ
ncbi:MAG TPA: ATP synthase F0 subunit B [Pyrinomonadaceae bacterium]|jgi:F0F1-type ATP synthase membrane subunit b/b'|nr:ATP synthase F0 subunit B [Pyrinomonadaceae bacterium]